LSSNQSNQTGAGISLAKPSLTVPGSPETQERKLSLVKPAVNNILGEARVVNPKSSIFGGSHSTRPSVE
jgi:hypothetical protein